MAYAGLSGLTKLIESNIAEESQLQLLFDSTEFLNLTKHTSSAVSRYLFMLKSGGMNELA